MTYEMIYSLMQCGEVMEVYDAGMLDVYWLRLAVDKGWMTIEKANSWYETLMNL